jgi:hypothetical protein
MACGSAFHHLCAATYGGQEDNNLCGRGLALLGAVSGCRRVAGTLDAQQPERDGNSALEGPSEASEEEDEEQQRASVGGKPSYPPSRAPCTAFLAAMSFSNERDFSALSFVYSKLRRSMSDDNVARKLFLLLNPDWWTPNPGLKNDPVWKGIVEKAGLAEKYEADSEDDVPESDVE